MEKLKGISVYVGLSDYNIEETLNYLTVAKEKGIDFEEEDTKYYAEVEKHLIAQTLAYIKKNQKYFR